MEAAAKTLTALITGSSSGIGLELTRRLLTENWEIIALNRSDFADRDQQIQEAVKKGKLRTYQADLTDFAALKAVLARIKEKEAKIDVLFNNAGGSLNELRFSKQGRELHFELQTVVPYVVLMELKDLLKKGALKTVINTSSTAFKTLKELEASKLERPTAFKKLFGPYAATKLALSLWTKEAAPLLAKEGIKIRSVDPGPNNTIRKNKKSGLPLLLKWIMKTVFPPPTRGAGLLYDGAFGSAKDLSGVFLVKGSETQLKFADRGSEILERVDAIYKSEFAPDPIYRPESIK